MILLIKKALGLSSTPEDVSLKPRKINLSGNIVHFSMPENFSRDMPAEDMIEQVDLSDKSIYQDNTKFTLIRRWWDFKEKGFFGKGVGSLMMSLYVKEASSALNLTTLKPLDFIDIIVDDIKRNNPTEEDADMIWGDYFANYDENWFQQQRWVVCVQMHSLSADKHTMLYAIPVTDTQYIVTEFVQAPDSGVGLVYFVDQLSFPFVKQIMDSFYIEYKQGSPVKEAVLDHGGPSLRELIEQKQKRLKLEK